MLSPSQVHTVKLTRRTNLVVMVLVLLPLLVFGVLVAFYSQRPLAKVVILPFQERTPSRLQASVERGWSWLRFHLFGPGRSILVTASIIHVSTTALSDLRLAAPDYSNSNGLRVWILKDEELQSLDQQIRDLPGTETVSNPRIQTASGIAGTMFVGQSVPVNGTNQEVGLWFKCSPRARRDTIDLTSTLSFSELQGTSPMSIKTNLAVRSRIQIPRGNGVLLLSANESARNGKATGISIYPTVR